MKLHLLLAGLSACSALVMAPRGGAWAAPAPACTPATMTPKAAVIPANLPGFGYTALLAKSTDVHLVEVGVSPELPLTTGPVADGLLKVTPVAPLKPGSSYRLAFSPFCNYGAVAPSDPLTFTAAAEAPLPTRLGSAQAALAVTLQDYGTTQYTITGSFALDPEMKPWAGVYQLVVVLDGKLVGTKATLTPANDGVQVVATGWCDAANAATRTHTVQLRGRLPFATTLDTAASTLDFVCPAPSIGTPANNPPTAPTESTSGQPPDGQGQGVKNGRGPTASGCSVGAAHGKSSSLPLLVLALGLAALARRGSRVHRSLDAWMTMRRGLTCALALGLHVVLARA